MAAGFDSTFTRVEASFLTPIHQADTALMTPTTATYMHTRCMSPPACFCRAVATMGVMPPANIPANW